jgi:hypothetical protein
MRRRFDVVVRRGLGRRKREREREKSWLEKKDG